jgi:hypothetical protein
LLCRDQIKFAGRFFVEQRAVFLVSAAPMLGIGKGLGKHFNENIVAQQAACMHNSASKCEIVFRKVE